MGVVTLYKAQDGWRWHRVVSSDVVSESGESYENKSHAKDMAVENAQPGDTLRIVEGEATIEVSITEGGTVET